MLDSKVQISKALELPAVLTEDERTQNHYEFLQQGKNVDRRIYTVILRVSAFYFLHTLLLHVTGPNSFTVVRTAGSNVYPTYRETCLCPGLLSDDGGWKRVLQDAFESSF